MLQILNLQEARDWSEHNLYEADSFMFPLEVAVRRGLLIKIDNEHFAVTETEYNGCTCVIEKIWRLTDEEMKANDLYCRYRYKEKIIQCPKDYKGWMEHEAGFNL